MAHASTSLAGGSPCLRASGMRASRSLLRAPSLRRGWPTSGPHKRGKVGGCLGARAQQVDRAVVSADPGTFPEVGQVCAVLGTQWGDEGKGKLVDAMAQSFDVVARAQGGANAGHTIYGPDGTKYSLHLIPCGILNPTAQCVIGNGCVVHIPKVLEEIAGLEAKGIGVQGRLFVSDRAHVLLDLHKEADGLREQELADKKIGTTKRGIGPCYSSKAIRNGIRVHDLLHPDVLEQKLRALVRESERRFADQGFECDAEKEVEAYREYAEKMKPYIVDSVSFLEDAHAQGRRILIEGANATMLDIDFGTYPYVTSSSTSIGGVLSGLGMAPNKLSEVVGVAKAYTTRVGEGPYPTELFGDLAEQIRESGGEYGTTTGRPRRCGWLDVVALRYACLVNGFTRLNVTKLDVLTGLDEIKIGTGYKYASGGDAARSSFPSDLTKLGDGLEVEYETMPGWKEDISGARRYQDLPAEARRYIERMEELVGVPIRWIGVGVARDAFVIKGS